MNQTFDPKPIPAVTWDNMLPPFKDHVYFEHSRAFPFRWTATGFDLVNAWWLSEAALLVYAEPGFARPKLLRAGFEKVWFLSGISTQCYVAAGAHGTMVAFRGTQCDPRLFGDFVADLKTDLNIRFVELERGGKVHSGFNAALDEVWPALAGLLGDPAVAGRPLWFTGHSLGGALAILAADRMETAQGIYTFGCPRVGDQAFVHRLDLPIYRFINNNDMVTHLPPMPYRDAGQMRYIDSEGRIHDHIDAWDRWLDEVQGHLQGFMAAFAHGLPALMPDGLKDHTPVLYALHIWNHLVRQADKARG